MAPGKVSKVEGIKSASGRLRGTIAAELQQPSRLFDEIDHQLLKFHGIYQGYDRDSATELKQQGLNKRHEFMARVKAPGGIMTAEQYLAVDALAQRYAALGLRITTRQGLQFHAVAKENLWATIHGVNQALLTTFAACGDVVRNVTASAAPIEDAPHRQLRADAEMLAKVLAPQTRAYHEIWLGDDQVAPPLLPETEAEFDPLYGPTYLPRKFKIGLALPEDNDIDVLTNDLAILPLFAGDTLTGYTLAIGGGLGMTHNKPHTYPRLATPVVFVEPAELLDSVKAVIKLHRDHGDRVDRRHARLKYVVDALGLAACKAELERHVGHPLADPPRLPPFQIKDHIGWHEQGDGRWYLGITIESGRIEDRGAYRLATALRRLMREIPLRPVFSPNQDIFLADIAPDDRRRVEAVLTEEGVPLPGGDTPLRRWALACPALPTCGLALNEAERVFDQVVGDIEAALARTGLAQERLSLRITGCPNGCARPYVGDIGLVGRTPDTYAIFLGGDFEGTRLNQRAFERVPIGELGRVLEPVFQLWARQRETGESFGNFCQRWGIERIAQLGAAAEAAE
jgi:sulfite reductase (ferredoxin)